MLQGPGSNDCKVLDRTLNILTSLPIIGLGMYTRRCVLQQHSLWYGLSNAQRIYHSNVAAMEPQPPKFTALLNGELLVKVQLYCECVPDQAQTCNVDII